MRDLERKPLPTGPDAPPGSLAAALATVPDPRRPYGWHPTHAPIPLVALLQVTVAATLCGARSLYAIAQWAEDRRQDAPALLEALGVPPGRRPCVATLHRVFKALDVQAFEAALGQWLSATGVARTDPLAIDGKTLRGIHGEAIPGVHLVAAYTHRAGAILGQLQTAGKGQELAAAQALLAQVPLAGRLVTTDALLTQREVAQQVVDGGGDYLLPVKANQPTLHADLATAFSPLAGDGA
jgi:DDE_Tnp_1-associated/Transposase DDE domain